MPKLLAHRQVLSTWERIMSKYHYHFFRFTTKSSYLAGSCPAVALADCLRGIVATVEGLSAGGDFAGLLMSAAGALTTCSSLADSSDVVPVGEAGMLTSAAAGLIGRSSPADRITAGGVYGGVAGAAGGAEESLLSGLLEIGGETIPV